MKILLCSFIIVLVSLANVAWCALPPMPTTGGYRPITDPCDKEEDRICTCGTVQCNALSACIESKCVMNHFAKPACEEGQSNCYCGDLDHGAANPTYQAISRRPPSYCHRDKTCKDKECKFEACTEEGQENCECAGTGCTEACHLSQRRCGDSPICNEGDSECTCGNNGDLCSSFQTCTKGTCLYAACTEEGQENCDCNGEEVCIEAYCYEGKCGQYRCDEKKDSHCVCGAEKEWCAWGQMCTKGTCAINHSEATACKDENDFLCICGTEPETYCQHDQSCVDGECKSKW